MFWHMYTQITSKVGILADRSVFPHFGSWRWPFPIGNGFFILHNTTERRWQKEKEQHWGWGAEFRGFSFGYDSPTDGEVVFSTAMVGYPESLTDPSYSGQILCVTYPLIGNYGVPSEGFDENGISRNFESERIWVRGMVISNYSFDYSHWDAVKSLDQWLKEQKIPGR